jgi:hypothetical protein
MICVQTLRAWSGAILLAVQMATARCTTLSGSGSSIMLRLQVSNDNFFCSKK